MAMNYSASLHGNVRFSLTVGLAILISLNFPAIDWDFPIRMFKREKRPSTICSYIILFSVKFFKTYTSHEHPNLAIIIDCR